MSSSGRNDDANQPVTRDDRPADGENASNASSASSDGESDAMLRAIAHAPARRPPDTGVPGTRWGDSGRYVIDRRLGRGGMGTVYAATDSVLGRVIALKVLDVADAGRDAVQHARLLREARFAARVEHERIARVYDVGSHDGFAFVAMEYVQGGTLRQWMTGRDVSLVQIVDIAMQIAEGLAELHAKGVIHRDLKPENVMLTAQGGIKLLDFGLARYSVAETDPTGPTQPDRPAGPGASVAPVGTSLVAASGTPGYMAPEQYANRPIDARVDIFALGVILYELITGERLFRGATMRDVMQATLEWAPVLRGGTWGRVPAQLRDHTARMLARDPEERFADGASVLAALRELDVAAPSRSVRLPAAIVQTIDNAPTEPALPVLPRRIWSRIAARGVEIGCAVAAAVMFVVQRPTHRPPLPPPVDMVRIDVGEIEVGQDVADLDRECAQIGPKCKRTQMLTEVPRAKVTVAAFFLDRNEVTNQQFATALSTLSATVTVIEDDDVHYPRYVRKNPGSGSEPTLIDLHPNGGVEYIKASGFRARPGREDLPVSQVSWYGAQLFCEAVGKRLPTEDEWEAAARGRENRRFPWGEDAPRCGAVAIANDGEIYPMSPRCPEIAAPRVVGSSPQDVSPEGVHDLGGNVAEWTSSGYVQGNRVAHLQAGIAPASRVIRGGSWGTSFMARSSGRNVMSPSVVGANLGFRCASNTPDAQP